ncbi:MAG: ABC transporter ATP-binding protein [Anaerolineales bacterium]
MSAIEVQDLKKTYGATRAVDGVSFSVGQGEIFGMLGPNGAGKTTTTEILEGLRPPDSGAVRVLGLDVAREPQKIKERIGVQLQTTALYPRLTVREVLDLFGTFYRGKTRTTAELIEIMNLGEKQNTRSMDLSGGQRQRLSVALALVNKPEILFLDEPTTGLDPQARRSLWEVIRSVNRDGATVFLTTHYMDEAEALCQRVAVVDRGRIIAIDSPQELIRQSFRETAIEFDQKGAKAPDGTFRHLKGVTRPAIRENGHVTIYTENATQTLGGLTDLAEAGTIQFDDLHLRRATLEDVFLKLTGKRIRE